MGQAGEKPKGLIKIILSLAFLAVVIFALLNYHFLIDTISTINYSASAEVTALEEKLNLTDRAKLIYRASHPSLDDRESFNLNCQSHNAEVSILGCYTNRSIHLYDISEPDLQGIVESTTAHELLHGVWSRLNPIDQANLRDQILTFYNSHPELSEELANYSEDERLDELHSRIGTEYADLPLSLEQHYSQFFVNQDAIVAYYDQYSQKFLELKEQITTLDAALTKSTAKIDTMRTEYESRLADLNARIDQFNACANRAGCFTEADFVAQRATLLADQDALEDYYYELNDVVKAHNALVDQYNDNILRSRNLENAANSNAEPIEKL